jgi:hypothetical protein
MDFKNKSLKSMILILMPGVLLIGLFFWKLSSKTEPIDSQTVAALPQVVKEVPPKDVFVPTPPTAPIAGDAVIEQELDSERLRHKQTRDLRNKLEQTNLELEEQKALAQINKLKKENRGAFNEENTDAQNNLPEIKVDYIGGDTVKKEAILSIGGTSYQVKEKSMPRADVQVISISNSGVTLHFTAPRELTKTIDYKPE